MSFLEPNTMRIGDRYRLTEYVENIRVASGEYFLVWTSGPLDQGYPVLGFAKVEKGRAPEVYAMQAGVQFGDRTWRHAHKDASGRRWEPYSPAGCETWNFSRIEIASLE